ncbi:MAG: tetratricopeptide repeat protein [Chthoniobacteraceae bacterium]
MANATDLSLSKEGERKAQALAHFADGFIAEEDGETDRAFESYRRSLSADPNNPDLAVKVAFEMARRGEVSEGISLLKDAAKAAPREMLPPLCLSQIYAKFLKKPALAIRYATIALDLDPDNISPYLALIELYTQANQPQKAVAILDRALKSKSPDADFWAQLGDLCLKLDQPQDGSPVPKEKLPRITALFEKARKLAPQDREIAGKAADFYYETQQFEAAIPLLRKLIGEEEDPASGDALALGEKLARALMGLDRRPEALKVLEKMAVDAPERKETFALTGDNHLLEGNIDQALKAYQRVLELDPSIAPVYLRIADLQMRLGQKETAIATLQEARKKFPGTALITYSLAATLAQAGLYSQALPVFEETLHEAPVSKPALTNASFYFAYGMAAEQAGDLDQAATLLQKSISLAPNDSAQARNYLGYSWLEHGKHLKEAGELIQRAVADEPENGAFLDSLGWFFYKTGDFTHAILNLMKAVEKLPEPDPVILEHLGDAYAAKGDLARALEVWKKAAALEGASKELPGKISAASQKLGSKP